MTGVFKATVSTGSVVSTEEGEIRITSVSETNSLLIQATQNQYSSIQAAIERIDQEPLQVLIESQILDVELNEDLQFGVNWYLTNNPNAVPPDGSDSISHGLMNWRLAAAPTFLQILSVPVGSAFMQATITALDSVTDVRSLGAPSLLVRNNATATITVGTQVPVQSSSISTGNSQRGQQCAIRFHGCDADGDTENQPGRPGLHGRHAGGEPPGCA